MKLVRYGKPGKEKPGVIDAKGKLRDCSSIVPDFSGEYVSPKHPKKVAKALKNGELKAVAGSPRIGACADTGHWMRSNLIPLDAIKALEGRIISFHLKDLGEMGNPGAHDVIWGTGLGNVEAVLTEIKRQNIEKPRFSIEYEHNWDNNVPDIAQCVAYFDQVAAKLSAQ